MIGGRLAQLHLWLAAAVLLRPGQPAAAAGLVGQSLDAPVMRVAPADARDAGPADRDAVVPVTVSLRIQQAEALEALLAAQVRRGSPEFHRWLTSEEFAAHFGTPVREYDRMVAWLERQGLSVQTWPSRLRIDAVGRVRDVERAFALGMRRYEQHGRQALGTAGSPVIPTTFRRFVSAIRTDSIPLLARHVRVLDVAGFTDAMGPQDMYTAYQARPAFARGVDGSDQLIAIVARSDFDVNDVRQFLQEFGVPSRDPVKVFPGKNPGIGSALGVCAGYSDPIQRRFCVLGELGEVLLDVEWASVMAPAARVLVSISDADVDVALADVVAHHIEAKIISISFGSCERLDPAAHALFAPLYAQAAAQGQTVIVSAGNNGADACADGRGASVNGIASDPHVTAAGGTALDPGFDTDGNATGYLAEWVWRDVSGAGGGGASALEGKPDYQQGPGVPADGARDLPDVSIIASPRSPGIVIIRDSAPMVVGGTSAAAPIWAGIVALLNDAAGVVGAGAVNAALYALGREQYGGSGRTPFHDIVTGDNAFNGVPGFTAGPGYDLASGLGTPDVDALVTAFSDSNCVGDCNGDHTVTIDEIVLGVRVALGESALATCEAMDGNADGEVTIDDIIAATVRAGTGC